MNKLLVISVLLLIGCSPASTNKAEKATTYPIPLGIWRSEEWTMKYDFSGLPYDKGLGLAEVDAGYEGPLAENQACKRFTSINFQNQSRQGYWFKNETEVIGGSGPSTVTIYIRVLEWHKSLADAKWLEKKYTLDRGSLVDDKGFRWFRQKEPTSISHR